LNSFRHAQDTRTTTFKTISAKPKKVKLVQTKMPATPEVLIIKEEYLPISSLGNGFT
jgi:hypothetical protein